MPHRVPHRAPHRPTSEIGAAALGGDENFHRNVICFSARVRDKNKRRKSPLKLPPPSPVACERSAQHETFERANSAARDTCNQARSRVIALNAINARSTNRISLSTASNPTRGLNRSTFNTGQVRKLAVNEERARARVKCGRAAAKSVIRYLAPKTSRFSLAAASRHSFSDSLPFRLLLRSPQPRTQHIFSRSTLYIE